MVQLYIRGPKKRTMYRRSSVLTAETSSSTGRGSMGIIRHSYNPIYIGGTFFQANLDGTDLHQITHEYFYQVSPPAVSPDGKNMAAVIETDDDPERIAIYSLEHREISARFLQPKIPGGSKHDPIYNFPNFLPDSKTLVFIAASERLIGPFDYDIYQMNIETGAIERLTKGNGYATDLKVSADGKTAVFLKWHSDWHGTPDRSQLEILDLQTRVVTSLQIKGLD